jgi:hypothetical protein
MPLKRISEAYPPKFVPAENYPMGQWIRSRIRSVVQEDYPEGIRYALVCDELDGRPWAEGKPAKLPESQAKILGFNYGDAPEGWVGRLVDLAPYPYNVQGKSGVTWHVMPVHERPAAAPPAPIVASAANTRPRQPAPPPQPVGNGQDRLNELLPNDEVPRFDPPETPAAAAAQEKGRRPGRPRKEMR